MKKILIVMMAFVLMLTGCGGSDDESEYTEKAVENVNKVVSKDTAPDIDKISSIAAISDKSSALKDSFVLSQARDEEESVADDIWTICVYLCGADLESENSEGVYNMQCMWEGVSNDKVRYIVQTGGSSEWHLDGISSDKLTRLYIDEEDMYPLEELPLQSMGSEETFEDFVKYCCSNFNSERMGFIIWNHGGGSGSGVCFDELFEDESLSVKDINTAFGNASSVMDKKIDFIATDACLMGSAEFANAMSPYADYLYASQEIAYGWPYQLLSAKICENPAISGEELGKYVADIYYEMTDQIGRSNNTCFSVIDLNKFDEFVNEFNSYAKEVYGNTGDVSKVTSIVRKIGKIDSFGGNNDAEGYTNMVDMVSLIDVFSEYGNPDKVYEAFDNALVRCVKGQNHEKSNGLSVYYPLKCNGSGEYNSFKDCCISPYYFAFIDRTINRGDFEYSEEQLDEMWNSQHGGFEEEVEYDYEPGESKLINFSKKPGLYEDDYNYSFVLAEDSLDYVASVCARAYFLSDDGKDMIMLGESADMTMDFDSGEFSAPFDGYWFCLPDGQPLTTYIISQEDGYDIYSSPIELNGKRTNLRIRHNYNDDEIIIEGVWDGIDANGMASREIIELKKGDKIVPISEAIGIETDEEVDYVGETYTYDGTSEITYGLLWDGNYIYDIYIEDVYGDYYLTDAVFYEIDGEDMFLLE